MPPKRNNNHVDGKDGGETGKSGKKHRATTTVDAATVDATAVDANSSCTETALPNATNLGAVFEAAANNALPAPESNLVPDATSIDATQSVIMHEEPAGTTDVTAAITTTDEPHLESFLYDLPFTIFDRFVASDCPWAIDKQTLNAQHLFSASGERRRKEVKDDFEWLHHTTRPADIAATREAYQSNYCLNDDGIQTRDSKHSSLKNRIPASVSKRVADVGTHSVVMNHSLCMIEQDINWLIKPIGNLLDRIQSSAKRGSTRSTLKDARMGQDLFNCSAFCNANDFVCSSDDIELVDFVQHDAAKKIWHCSNLIKSDMLRDAIVKAYTSAVDGDKRFSDEPSWLSLMQPAKAKDRREPIQFLGLVSLYETKSGNKVAAFRLHTFILYCWDAKTKSTRVQLLLSEQRLTQTSAPERMLQIVQLVQSDQVQSTSISILPEFIFTDVGNTYTSLGFSKRTATKTTDATVFARHSPIKISKFTNRIMWGRYGKHLTMFCDEIPEGMESMLQMQCRLVSQLLLRPMSANESVGIKLGMTDLHEFLSYLIESEKGIENDIGLCARVVRKMAAPVTRIPLAVITHATVARMLAVKGPISKHVYETTLELLQYVSVALVTAVPSFHSFVGDSHKCVLFCEKCQQPFGRTGQIFQVMLEAPHSILYHHGLELTEFTTDEDDPVDQDESRFSKSLPMHALKNGMGALSLSLNKTLDSMPSQRCTFGCANKQSSKMTHIKNIHFMHNLDEAMRIDSNFAGDNAILSSRSACTSAMLFSIFNCLSLANSDITAHDRKTTDEIESFDEFGISVDDAVTIGEKWIESKMLDASVTNQLKIGVGWCSTLSQQFLFNFAYISKRLCQSLKTSFTVDSLLAHIGIDHRRPHLLRNCLSYTMSSDVLHDFDILLVDKQITVCVTTCLSARPIFETVEEIDEIGTLSKLGNGWNASLCKTWFCKKNQEDDSAPRQIRNKTEADESIIILKTASSVTLEYESDELGRGYMLSCNVDDIIRKNPSVLTGPHQSFYKEPTIQCSNSIITSLPFQFVKSLQIGKQQNLPKAWKSMVKKDADRAYSKVMTSIQLWRHRSCIGKKGKITRERIYRATFEVLHKGIIATTTAFIRQQDATRYILSERWIVEQVTSLCSTRNYREIIFGEGAKSSKDGHPQVTRDECKENFWHSNENHTKLCTEGAVANMLFHLNMKEEANEFKAISTLSKNELLKVLCLAAVPKRVMDKHHCMDPLEKCMWILEMRYNCRRLGYLNTQRFKTATMFVENMRDIRLPLLISVCGENSVYNHVVVVWRGIIIDFESIETYSLTVKNVENICGPKNAFHHVRCGFIILPSKQMKVAINDFTDWGEKHVREKLRHLLRSTKFSV